jgi:ankyrin repeat protein
MALAEWFLARGADVTTRNFQNRTALQVAEASGQEEAAALLRQYGATE